MIDTYKAFSNVLNEQGLSAYKVSMGMGIDRTYFSRWKQGYMTPSVAGLCEIADFLKVPVARFFEEFSEAEGE